MSDLTEAIEVLEHEMKAHEIPSKAVNMANYLKNKFVCYGIKSPVRNEIQKSWFASIKGKGLDHWDVIFNVWDHDQREFQYIAIDYLNKIPKKDINLGDHKFIEELITTKSWWDSVDSIASNFTGKYFQKFPEQKDVIIERWRNSDNMWLNRTCLIFQLKYKDNVDFDLMKSLIKQYQGNPEFFIQKAIGWSLRQYSKFNPAAVKEFVEEISLQGLARREAIKYV